MFYGPLDVNVVAINHYFWLWNHLPLLLLAKCLWRLSFITDMLTLLAKCLWRLSFITDMLTLLAYAPFFFFFLALFKGFCQVFAFVGSIHLSRRKLVSWHFPSSVTYILQGGILLLGIFIWLTPYLRDFCQVFGLVSNLHPSRRDLVT